MESGETDLFQGICYFAARRFAVRPRSVVVAVFKTHELGRVLKIIEGFALS